MNPFYEPYRVLYKIYTEGAHLKIALADTDWEEETRARTVKTVYGVLENEKYLSYCIQTFAPKSPKAAVRIVLKIALYWLIFLGKPRYAVTDMAAELCKKLGKGGVAGFVNAFLRRFDEGKIALPEGDEGLSIRYNFPLFAVKRLKAQYGDRTESILKAKSGGVSVRFVKGSSEYVQLPHTETPLENVYLFPNFVRDENFFKGNYTFQSVGSVAICSVVERAERFLDCCAAPGGKSVLLSERCAQVTACDIHEHRVKLIETYAKRMGRENITAVLSDSSVFRADWEEGFDGVLCDVPCSGLGTVSENPDIVLRSSEEKLSELNHVQYGILKNCARYVKKGGYLYYSTCSLLEEENDNVVQRFLSENTAFTAEKADCPLDYKRTAFGLQFLPDIAFGAGFYVSKLRKLC